LSVRFSSVGQEKVDIGKDSQVGPFSTIGFTGFAFEKNKEGTDFKYPLRRQAHDYKVKIGDRVQIGQGCNVDRGSWRDTAIGNGTKIDSHVNIAHDVVIGKNCIIGAGVIILSSCSIGNNVFIGGGVIIKDHIKIGNNSTIDNGMNVIEDVPKDSVVVNKTRL